MSNWGTSHAAINTGYGNRSMLHPEQMGQPPYWWKPSIRPEFLSAKGGMFIRPYEVATRQADDLIRRKQEMERLFDRINQQQSNPQDAEGGFDFSLFSDIAANLGQGAIDALLKGAESLGVSLFTALKDPKKLLVAISWFSPTWAIRLAKFFGVKPPPIIKKPKPKPGPGGRPKPKPWRQIYEDDEEEEEEEDVDPYSLPPGFFDETKPKPKPKPKPRPKPSVKPAGKTPPGKKLSKKEQYERLRVAMKKLYNEDRELYYEKVKEIGPALIETLGLPLK